MELPGVHQGISVHRSQLLRIKMLGKDAEVSSHFSVGLHKGSEDSGSAGMASAGPETKKANFVQS